MDNHFSNSTKTFQGYVCGVWVCMGGNQQLKTFTHEKQFHPKGIQFMRIIFSPFVSNGKNPTMLLLYLK